MLESVKLSFFTTLSNSRTIPIEDDQVNPEKLLIVGLGGDCDIEGALQRLPALPVSESGSWISQLEAPGDQATCRREQEVKRIQC